MRILLAVMLLGCVEPGAKPVSHRVDPAVSDISAPADAPEQTSSEAAQRCEGPNVSQARNAQAQEAFEVAEKFFRSEFVPFRIPNAPKTKAEGDRVLGRLIDVSERSRELYKKSSDFGGPWALAAHVRMGDVYFAQAQKLTMIPHPIAIIPITTQLPKMNVYVEYAVVMEALTTPLEEAAGAQWAIAAAQGKELCLPTSWTMLAAVRLAHLHEIHTPSRASSMLPGKPAFSSLLACSVPNEVRPLSAASEAELDKVQSFYLESFANYRVKLAPQTGTEAKAIMSEINMLAGRARAKFLETARRNPALAIAAHLLAGDVTYHQARMFLDIPAPKNISSPQVPQAVNQRLLDYHRDVAHAASALEDLSRTYWNTAIRDGQLLCIKSKWTKLAKERLLRPRLSMP